MKKQSNKFIKNDTLRKKHKNNDMTKSRFSLNEKQYAFLITIIFMVLGLIGIQFHEMWRDEYQAWLIAKYSANFSNLLQNCRYEHGHLFLWYLVLFVITRFTSNIFFMQLVHVMLATSVVYLITKYSPFSRLQKALIPFGYFFVYEYSIIARPYSLTMLVVFLAVIFYKNFLNRIVQLAIVLAVLANIHIYSFVFVSAFIVLIVYKLWLTRNGHVLDKLQKYKVINASLILGIGVLLSFIQIIRSQTEFDRDYLRWSGGFNFFVAMKKALTAFCPFPPIDRVNIWNQFILDSLPAAIPFLIFIILLVVLVIYFSKSKEILAMFITGVIVISLFLYSSNTSGARYQGQLFILFITVFWLSKYNSESTPIKGLNSIRGRLNSITEKTIMAILLIQIASGAVMFYQDINYPFSNIGRAAEFIKENNLTNYYTCGCADYMVSPMTALIDKPIFFPQRNAAGNFIIWDDIRIPTIRGDVMFSRLSPKVLEKDSILFIFSQAITDKNGSILNNISFTNKGFRIEGKLLGACDDNCMTGDEVYYFYELKKVRPVIAGVGDRR